MGINFGLGRAGLARLAAVIILAAVLAGRASGDSGWKTVKNGDFTVFYGPGHGAEAVSVLRAMEDARAYVTPWTGSLALGVPVTIEDAGLYANGFADPVYFRLHLFSSPPAIKTLFAVEDWWELVAVHEYTHMSHMTAVRGNTAFFAAVIGRVGSPNIFSPTWLTEGLATNVESSISPYQGRLNDGFFDAYLLARARDGRLPQLEQASLGLMEFPGGMAPYLYGSEFLQWLSRTPSGGRFPVFVQENGSRLMAFVSPVLPWAGVDASARKVWGRGFPDFWDEWKSDVTARSASFYIDGERVTERGWYVSDLVVDGGRLLYRRSFSEKTGAFTGFQFDEIVERDLATGLEKVLRRGLPVGMSRMQLAGGKIWFATQELGRGYSNTFFRSFGYETLIHEWDPATGHDRVVVRDRARAFTVLPGGRVLFSRDRRSAFGETSPPWGGSGSEIVMYDPVSRKKEVLFSPDLLVDEMVSDGTRVVVSARANRENLSIFLLDLEKRVLVPLVRTPFQEGTPTIAGDRVLFTANYDRVYSAYSVEIASGRVEKLTGGGFSAYPVRAGEWLYFVGLNSWGFDLYRRKYEPREFSLPTDQPFVRPPSAFDPGQVGKGGYGDNLARLLPAIRTPFIDVVATDKVTTREQYGISLQGMDTVGDFPSYGVIVGYDNLDRRVIGSGNLSSLFFSPLMLEAAGGGLDGRELGFSFEYPLVKALSPGLTGVSVGASFDDFDDFSRRQVAPFESISLAFPETRLAVSAIFPQERQEWGGSASGSSVYLLTRMVQHLPGSQISLFSMAFRNSGDVGTTISPIRGYGSDIFATSGAVIKADLTRPVLKVGKGIWNPTLYFEDLTGGLFVDAVTPDGRAAGYSYGAELHLETWVTNMGAALDWGVQVARHRDGESSWSAMAFTSSSLTVDGLWRLPSAIRGAVRALGGIDGQEDRRDLPSR